MHTIHSDIFIIIFVPLFLGIFASFIYFTQHWLVCLESVQYFGKTTVFQIKAVSMSPILRFILFCAFLSFVSSQDSLKDVELFGNPSGIPQEDLYKASLSFWENHMPELAKELLQDPSQFVASHFIPKLLPMLPMRQRQPQY